MQAAVLLTLVSGTESVGRRGMRQAASPVVSAANTS